ncbi:MAG: hypothetical protein HOE10_07540 [Deltaproteobacteria bacterium]|jgi:hypothetical protein|nr:hypothetical protein [Deltaproteobacteria bacterium]
MLKKLPKIILFLGLLFFIAGCSSAKLFYSYGDSIVSWQLDSYFDLTNEQEEWVEERMRLHLEWHHNEELPRYRRFLLDIQKSAKDGLTMSELDEGFYRFGTKVDRIFERLIPDVVLFLSEISPEQINNLELVMDEENEEMMKRMENQQELIQERHENFWDQMEDWFGEFSISQREQITELQTKWFTESPDPSPERMERRRKSQLQFLALLRSVPEKKELEKWFRQWSLSWEGETNPARKTKIIQNKKRILLIDAILSPEQQLHAVRELDDWVEILEEKIENP